MAPPVAPKQYNTAAAQSVSLQGRNAREKIVDEVDRDTLTDCMGMDDEANDDELDSSKGTDIQKLIIQSLNDQKKRHVVNKKRVKEDYYSVRTKLQHDIVKLFDEHEHQSDTAHCAQLTRLADLLALKTSLELQMTSKLAHLRAAYNAHSKELSMAVDSRIKELE